MEIVKKYARIIGYIFLGIYVLSGGLYPRSELKMLLPGTLYKQLIVADGVRLLCFLVLFSLIEGMTSKKRFGKIAIVLEVLVIGVFIYFYFLES